MSEDDYDYLDDVEVEDSIEASLMLDPETRIWKLELRGPAAMILFFMLDHSDTSITNKLWTEAKFDQMMKYDLGELNDDA